MSVPLAHEDAGGNGPPLLILHGLFGSSMNWRRIAKGLASTHRVMAVDLRNHGASPWAGSMTYADMAEDVADFIDRHGLGRPAILGHSMGGKVAMTLALNDAARVERLVVADVAPVTYHHGFGSYTDAMRGAAALNATTRDEVKHWLAQSIPDERTVGFLMTNLVRHGEQYDWRINVAALGANMAAIGGWPEPAPGARFDRPVTVVSGSRSDYVGADDHARFAALFPQVRFVTIPDAGHWLHADQPDAFIDAVRTALNQ